MPFTVRVSVDDIAAAHFLPGYDGPCAVLHGHNWSITARIQADRLHEDMVVDFRGVKEIFKAMDHQNLNEIAALTTAGRRPTAERLAEYLAERVAEYLSTLPNAPRLLALTVRETSRNEVTFEPEASG